MAANVHNKDPAVTLALGASLLSLLFWGFVLIFGFDQPPVAAPSDYETYFQQGNWWPFPVFFLAVAPGLWFTWVPLLRAWLELKDTGVLRAKNGSPCQASLDRLRESLSRHRRIAVFAALVVAAFVNGADWQPNFGVFFGDSPRHAQLRIACDYQSPSVKWLLEAEEESAILCLNRRAAAGGSQATEHIPQPLPQLFLNLFLMAQQFLLVFLAALAVMQLLLHTWLFTRFERLQVAKDEGLSLRLNARSPLNEFGLEHWNFALNNFYWSASPAMLAVFLSRAATNPEDYLPGQALLAFAVPACLIGPMVATILARQARLPDCWRELASEGPEAAEDYRRQQLWPLDRNWSSKLGIVLAFALAALSIGFEVHYLMGL